MAHIVISDDGIAFDGTTPDHRPLGGAESAVIALAEALAVRGHRVDVVNKCSQPITHKDVCYHPIGDGFPAACDLHIANRGDKLIRAIPAAGQTVFWCHNPAGYMMKWRYMWKLALGQIPLVFLGAYHASTYPEWAPGGARHVIPHGVDALFQAKISPENATCPQGRKAIFTSNPLRGLDWLLSVWGTYVVPHVPDAELHVFSGAATYGATGDAKAAAMAAVLDKAKAMADQGVVLRNPVGKADLVAELETARVMVYRGDANETFCMAVAEAQALGIPAVVQPFGSMAERVHHGVTGYVEADDAAFGAAAVRLLADDSHWLAMHKHTLAQGQRDWDAVAADFERFLPNAAR